MTNIPSIFRITTFNLAFAIRPAHRFISWANVLVSYFQYLLARHFLFADTTTLQAHMRGQTCYLEKMLQLYITPRALIDPLAYYVLMYRDDDPEGEDLYINDTSGQKFYTDLEFNLPPFSVILPESFSHLTWYALELLNNNKLPGTEPRFIYI